METNFFTTINGLPRAGVWKITIAKSENGQMLVSLLLEKEKNGTPIAPMIFNGSPQELDEGFFGAVAKPVKSTSELFANIDAHLLSIEKAKKEIKPKEQRQNGENTVTSKSEDKTERKKRYDDLIEKAKNLNSACKYAEALAVLPRNEDFPEKEEELNGLRRKLGERNKQMALL